MEDGALGLYPNIVSCPLHAPTQVDFLHVREQHRIQTTELFKDAGLQCQSGTGSPKDFARLVVLADIGFKVVQDAATAEGIA